METYFINAGKNAGNVYASTFQAWQFVPCILLVITTGRSSSTLNYLTNLTSILTFTRGISLVLWRMEVWHYRTSWEFVLLKRLYDFNSSYNSGAWLQFYMKLVSAFSWNSTYCLNWRTRGTVKKDSTWCRRRCLRSCRIKAIIWIRHSAIYPFTTCNIRKSLFSESFLEFFQYSKADEFLMKRKTENESIIGEKATLVKPLFRTFFCLWFVSTFLSVPKTGLI